jgi:hypothetical protein
MYKKYNQSLFIISAVSSIAADKILKQKLQIDFKLVIYTYFNGIHIMFMLNDW